MEFLTDYGLFLAETVTLVVAIIVVLTAAVSISHKARQKHEEGEIEVTRLNDRLKRMHEAVEAKLMEKGERKAWQKLKRKEEKARAKLARKEKKQASRDPEKRKRLFVIDFDGDIKASANESLRESITAIMGLAKQERGDEVVVRLESGGGLVHAYGLAAAQLDRVRQAKLPLTVCVDKVAASGGYMMACVADRIVASPFAVLGSIGVVAQLPNFHRLLKKHDVDYEVLTAGEYKRTLTVFGENTEKGRRKFLDDLEDTHGLFKDYVSERRPELDIDAVANGDIWFGQRALDVKLVDELMTSDQYLVDACESADVLLVKYEHPKSLAERLGVGVSQVTERTVMRLLQSLRDSRFGG
ncbi:protease SohB [Marinobacteraceae bacterium S3BR75-40.1]